MLLVHRDGADGAAAGCSPTFPPVPATARDDPAVGRGRWKADVRYVPSSSKRSHGAVLGIKLRRFCDGTRFRYVFY